MPGTQGSFVSCHKFDGSRPVLTGYRIATRRSQSNTMIPQPLNLAKQDDTGKRSYLIHVSTALKSSAKAISSLPAIRDNESGLQP